MPTGSELVCSSEQIGSERRKVEAAVLNRSRKEQHG
jgi:hypothetical protein